MSVASNQPMLWIASKVNIPNASARRHPQEYKTYRAVVSLCHYICLGHELHLCGLYLQTQSFKIRTQTLPMNAICMQ